MITNNNVKLPCNNSSGLSGSSGAILYPLQILFWISIIVIALLIKLTI